MFSGVSLLQHAVKGFVPHQDHGSSPYVLAVDFELTFEGWRHVGIRHHPSSVDHDFT
jgi:hypothetical protein